MKVSFKVWCAIQVAVVSVICSSVAFFGHGDMIPMIILGWGVSSVGSSLVLFSS